MFKLNLLILFVIGALIPSWFLISKNSLAPADAIVTFFDFTGLFGIGLLFLVVLQKLTRLWFLLCPILALVIIANFVLMLSWEYSGAQPDLLYAIDSFDDLFFTLQASFPRLFLISLVLLALGLALLTWGYFKVGGNLKSQRWFFFRPAFLFVLLPVFTFCWYFLPSQDRLLVSEILNSLDLFRHRTIVLPEIPDNSHLHTNSDESVFVLQIESANSVALNSAPTIDGKIYDGEYMPELKKIAKDGVFFPYAWSNSIQSNRSIISSLCGITNNISRSLSYTPNKISNLCLPEILKQSDYDTIFYWAFSNPKYTNLDATIKKIGFSELHDASIAEDKSVIHKWGVDDCVFYPKAFEHLRNNYAGVSSKLVYLKVSSHHYPFRGLKKYEKLNPFQPYTNFIEAYLNSFVQQDHCLNVFYEEFKKYRNDKTHLFIYGDHSWPVGIHGNTTNDQLAKSENFLVPFLYLPPVEDLKKYRVGQVIDSRIGLSHFPETVIDLLNGAEGTKSFSSLVRNESSSVYSDCHLLAQPYGSAEIVVVRGDRKYNYSVEERSLKVFDLSLGFPETTPVQIFSDIDYKAFKKEYFCDS